MRLNAKSLKISVMSSKINKDQPCVKMDEKSIALNILGYDCCSNPNKKYGRNIQVIPGNLPKRISTNYTLLQCKTLPAHFSINLLMHC